MKLWLATLLLVCLTAANAYDYKPPEIPPAGHAAKFPQNETHSTEGVTIAIDPYGPEKDSVLIVDLADPLNPKIVANLPL